MNGFPEWQDLATCPQIEDVERLGVWVDIDGAENIVIIHYDPSNEENAYRGFIGRHGVVYGGGGITKWMPMPMLPSEVGR